MIEAIDRSIPVFLKFITAECPLPASDKLDTAILIADRQLAGGGIKTADMVEFLRFKSQKIFILEPLKRYFSTGKFDNRSTGSGQRSEQFFAIQIEYGTISGSSGEVCSGDLARFQSKRDTEITFYRTVIGIYRRFTVPVGMPLTM